MPKKKKVGELPPVHGPGSARTVGPTGFYKAKDERRVSWSDGLEASLPTTAYSEPSTTVPLDMSRDDAIGLSQRLDDSLHLASGHSIAPDTINASDNWDIQTPDEIIQDVTQFIHTRKPWRPKLDDSILEQKHNERQDRLERGFHIILPDNRVRVMEDELSWRVRSSLLDMDPESAPAHWKPPESRRSERDPRNAKHLIRMRANPWYLKAQSWYCNKEKLDAESAAQRSNDFPYANVILNIPSPPKAELTPFQKENIGIVEPYKAYMKGNRLPHFLQ